MAEAKGLDLETDYLEFNELLHGSPRVIDILQLFNVLRSDDDEVVAEIIIGHKQLVDTGHFFKVYSYVLQAQLVTILELDFLRRVR